MKRILTIITMFIILWGMSIIGFAERYEKEDIKITDGMTQETFQAPAVNVLMGGKDIYTQMPPILYTHRDKSQVLVPIKFIVDELDAQISWDQRSKEAILKTKDKTIQLRVGSRYAIVNEKNVALPYNMKIQLLGYEDQYQVMVPISFVADEFGMEVNWIGETRTATIDFPRQSVTDIEQHVSQFFIKTTGKVNFTTMYLQGSQYGSNDRLMIDIPNTDLNVEDASFQKQNGLIIKDVNKYGVTSVRGSYLENVSRIVMDLKEPMEYNVTYDESIGGIKVDFISDEEIDSKQSSEELSGNGVQNITVEPLGDGKQISIYTKKEAVYTTMDLGNKGVIDILGAKLNMSKEEMNVSMEGIEKIRIKELNSEDESLVRIVLDLSEGTTFDDFIMDQKDTKTMIFSKKLSDSLKDSVSQTKTGLDYKKRTDDESIFNLKFNQKSRYSIDYAEGGNQLILTVPKSSVNLEETDYDINDGYLESVYVYASTDRDYDMIFQLSQDIKYEVKSDNGYDDEIQILFHKGKKNQNVPSKDSMYKGNGNKKLIVIDAGHGGKDPGTHGHILNLQEKNVALDTAKRLNDLLQKAGFATYMTRTDDTFVGLHERPARANGLGADLFISIHYNASENRSVSGIQTLYYKDASRNNKELAKIIQKHMVEKLQAPDKNLIQGAYIVLKETTMPAILSEVAFLTNQREEVLSNTKEYRQRAAEALCEGILEYFHQNPLR